MTNQKKRIGKLVLWFLFLQLLLVNASAFLYAYKFTHFQSQPKTSYARADVFSKTWKLFSGNVIYKDPSPPIWNGYEKVELKTAEGIVLEGWYKGSDSVKQCVLLFHGVTSRKDYFKHESAKFAEWGYNILLVDFRGHGNSGGNSTSYGVNETEEVELALDWSAKRGNTKNLLYGASMGGAVVLKAASEGVKATGVIADCSFGSLQDHFSARAGTLGFPSQPFAFLVTMWVGVQQGYNGFNHNIAEYARSIRLPVLVQSGDRDHLVKESETQEIFKNIPDQRKRLAIYSGADHHSYLLTHAVEWEKNVRAFADGL
ncbi:MAG: alpha/beta fold hydrolase [Flavisolibacter sp.]|nr:alpha/beta fold hydrolase [Flavisolibacter sp.]